MHRFRSVIFLAVASILGAIVATGCAAPPPPPPPPRVGFSAADLPTSQATGIVWALAARGNTVYAGGAFSSIRIPGGGATGASNFASFDAATGKPLSCHPSFNGEVRALRVSPDGATLYAGGSFTTVNGKVHSHLAAIDLASCQPRASFAPQVTGIVYAVSATATTVYFGGDVSKVNNVARQHAAAVTSAGALTGWRPNADNRVWALEAASGGRVVIGGAFGRINSAASNALGVVNGTTGATVRAFPGFIPARSVVKDILISGNAFYTGNEGSGTGVFDGRIAVSLDDYHQIWRDTCLGATQTLAVDGGVLYFGSHAHDCSSMREFGNGPRHYLLAEPTNPPASTPTTPQPQLLKWNPNTNGGIGDGVGPRAMIITGGGSYLWVGGEFTAVNGHAQQGLTRFGRA
jgi:hypothetical protein